MRKLYVNVILLLLLFATWCGIAVVWLRPDPELDPYLGATFDRAGWTFTDRAFEDAFDTTIDPEIVENSPAWSPPIPILR
jgi:hypothetical protein